MSTFFCGLWSSSCWICFFVFMLHCPCRKSQPSVTSHWSICCLCPFSVPHFSSVSIIMLLYSYYYYYFVIFIIIIILPWHYCQSLHANKINTDTKHDKEIEKKSKHFNTTTNNKNWINYAYTQICINTSIILKNRFVLCTSTLFKIQGRTIKINKKTQMTQPTCVANEL